MIHLAPSHKCTGCGACMVKCPKKCITMKEDSIGVVLPVLNPTDCVECHACEKVCPILNPLTPSYPQKAYAAWSLDEEERRKSASGGVAIELYKYALANGYNVVGASINDDFTVTHKVIDKVEDLAPLKNSKYVFSDAYDAFEKIRELLRNGESVLFIGLPCQVAAARKLFNDNANLLLVDLVCHGSAPHSYLIQHVRRLEKTHGQLVKNMTYRDPECLTQTFTFSLYNFDGERFYSKRTCDYEEYLFAYHKFVAYRENCYYCNFAKSERVSDLTLGDYHGLGKKAPCQYNHLKVSCVLVNSKKGHDFLNSLIGQTIHADERPVEEPIMGDSQLQHPCVKNKYRLIFEKAIRINNGDFETSIKKVIRHYKQDVLIRKLLKPLRLIGLLK